MMSIELGVVSFSYIPAESIMALEEIIISSDIDTLKKICDRYVLLSNDKANKFHHDCPIMEIVKSDIDKTTNPSHIRSRYNELINKYGKEVVDLLVVEDSKIIQNKIAEVLNFAMDKIYHSDAIRVEFNRFYNPFMKGTSIPSLIYSVIGENFDIIDQCVIGQPNYVIIKRRK